MSHNTLARESGLLTIPNLADSVAEGRVQGFRWQIAPPAFGVAAAPLIAGTEPFTCDSLAAWHRSPQESAQRDVACYVVSDAVVTGAGQVWVDNNIVTSPEIMPPYVAQALNIAEGGAAALHYCARLPIRTIAAPCLVAIGAATETYGHFLIEMLFRILVARRGWENAGRLPFKLLLAAATPAWLLRILADDLDIGKDDIETFEPWQERLLLRQAILPSRVFLDPMIHPVAGKLVDRLMEHLRVAEDHNLPRRIFVARGQFLTPEGFRRVCLNEQELIGLATARHGFTVVRPEEMRWREQMALFRNADVIVGLAGSGLHNALFCGPNSRVGSIGLLNYVQSEIGALRAQCNGYLTEGVELNGEYVVEAALFDAFVGAVCG